MQTDNLVRKQYLIHPVQVRKLELLAKREKTSAAEMVRKAIDAYNPDMPVDMDENELLDLIAIKVKEAIADTVATRKRLDQAFDKLGLSKDEG